MENELKFSSELVSLIKEKSELASLDDSFVKKILTASYLAIPDKYETFAQFKKSAICKIIVSQTRKDLRELYGVFIRKPLSKINQDDVESVLESHQSTKERFDYLETIYELLFDKLTSKGLPNDFSLLDIACGFTPFTISYFPTRPANYVACDLSSSDMASVQHFFKKQNQPGTAVAIDVVSEEFFSWVATQKADVCFLLKALDSFEQRKRNSSKPILDAIHARLVVVSFALFSIGGNAVIGAEKRTWFEKFCAKQNWTFETLQVPNEIFYIVVKE